MNQLDVAIGILLVLGGLRGLWRGLIREAFGMMALLGGLAVALRFTALGGTFIVERFGLPAAAAAGISFVTLFMALYTVLTVSGFALDRVLRSKLTRGFNRAAGCVFAVGKTGAVAAFLLLFLHLFPVVPRLERQMNESTLAPPLVAAAGGLMRTLRSPVFSGASRPA